MDYESTAMNIRVDNWINVRDTTSDICRVRKVDNQHRASHSNQSIAPINKLQSGSFFFFSTKGSIERPNDN